VKRSDYDRACDQSELNRKRVWPVKITP